MSYGLFGRLLLQLNYHDVILDGLGIVVGMEDLLVDLDHLEVILFVTAEVIVRTERS